MTPHNFYTTWYCLNCIYRLLELFLFDKTYFCLSNKFPRDSTRFVLVSHSSILRLFVDCGSNLSYTCRSASSYLPPQLICRLNFVYFIYFFEINYQVEILLLSFLLLLSLSLSLSCHHYHRHHLFSSSYSLSSAFASTCNAGGVALLVLYFF